MEPTAPVLRVEADAEALAAFAAAETARELRECVRRRGEALLALPGGETPRRFLELLAAADSIDWAKVVVVPADERVVPATDPRSNEGMIRAALLDRIGGPRPVLFGWEVEQGLGPETLRGRFEGRLLALLPEVDGIPQLDLTVLGMGADGHTASLFPGQAHADSAVVVAAHSPAGEARLSLGPAVLRGSRRLALLLQGAEKAATLAEVATGAYDPVRWPAQLAARRAGGAEVWCDSAAAGSLTPGI